MISYAQNREDALLARAFAQQATGFYIDIGASDPTYDSVTRHFYDLGWSGINVEPGECYTRLAAERTRDINLNCAVSSSEGVTVYYEFPGTGLSTLCEAEARSRIVEGRPLFTRQVATRTLASICKAYVSCKIDFISIDVEGHAREVIQGGDWRRWRPRVAAIEATRPNSTEPAYEDWEPLLLTAGYLFAVSDGLNRFYVREEDAALVGNLQQPLTVLDQIVPFVHVEQVQALQDRIGQLELALQAYERRSLRFWFARAAGKSRQWLRRAIDPRDHAALSGPTGPCPANS